MGFVALWTTANWAVATLLSGIGKLKEIFTVICYSIIPMVFGNIIYIIFSYMLNADEGEFLLIFVTAMQLYSVFMVIVGSIIIHDVSFGRFLAITLPYPDRNNNNNIPVCFNSHILSTGCGFCRHVMA